MTYKFLLVTGVLVGCLGCDGGDTKAPAATGDSAKSEKPKDDKPKGPTFTAKIDGAEKSEALVTKKLDEMGYEGFTIQAPKSAVVEKKGVKSKLVAPDVNYSLSISRGIFDVNGRKMTFAKADQKGEFVKEEAKELIFKRSNGSHIFAVGIEVDGKPYACTPVNTKTPFTRSVADQMIKSCRSIKKN